MKTTVKVLELALQIATGNVSPDRAIDGSMPSECIKAAKRILSKS